MNIIQRTPMSAKAKVLALVALATAAGTASAQDAAAMGAQILTKVTDSMSQGEMIAGAVVLGLFSIWAIKLLFRAK